MRASNLARKNLIVDERDIRALKRVLGVPSESEAVRNVVRERLLLVRAESALKRIRARRGIDDVYHRGARRAARKRQRA